MVASVNDELDYIVPSEEKKALSPRAVEKRQKEFLCGRAAANLALKELGFDNPPPIPQGPQREPIWPDGIVGSITHSGQWTLVVAARNSQVFAIGIDLEDSAKMTADEAIPLICSPSEQAWARQSSDPSVAATRLFCSKEATFKAFYPHCRCYFDFTDVELLWLPDREAFTGKLLTGLDHKYAKGYQFEVVCRSSSRWVFAYLIESAPTD